MTLRVILLCIILVFNHRQAYAVKATTTHTVFYKKNKTDSSQYDANIVLSWRAQNTSLHYLKNEKGNYSSEIICVLRFTTPTGNFKKEETYVIASPQRASIEEALAQLTADQYEFILPSGHYKLEMILFEQEYKNELYQFVDTFTVDEAPKQASFLSEIQILDTFYQSNKQTIFSRNNSIDVPLSSNYLNERRNSVCYYYELYEAKKAPENGYPLKLSTYVSWKPFSNQVPKYIRQDSVNLKASFQQFYVAFPTAELLSGNYYLNIVLSDKYDFELDKKCIFIQRYNTNSKVALSSGSMTDSIKKEEDTLVTSAHILDLTTTFIAKYDPSQIRAILKMMLLICDPAEGSSINGFLKKPDELYSKYFIYNFWEKRNKANPEKAWIEYTERIKEVNKLFSSGQSGYETERGRIYIQYGKPNDRIIVNNEAGALPYEIWQYYNTEKQGREGVFLFYKPGKSLGGYELLHSTLVGERRNGNWRALLYNNNLTGSSGLATDSKAEQYIGNK